MELIKEIGRGLLRKAGGYFKTGSNLLYGRFIRDRQTSWTTRIVGYLLLAILLVTAAILLAFFYSTVKYYGFYVILIALLIGAITDLVNRTIPDSVSIIIAAVGFIWLWQPVESLWGLLLAGLPLFILAMINTNWVGGGDVKLSAALGVSFGTSAVFFLAIASILALITSFGIRLYKKIRKVEFNYTLPFAPFIFLSVLGGFIYANFI
ncbi:prepilin peptidase [Thermicanus aegyptius]|uniref:prepilin peptidase n=1 Tax=Thermicanus aegyptius TaxID=94009 RepID=UPI00049139F9|nr:A24 family peptidase [Thermicanus aegyptius]